MIVVMSRRDRAVLVEIERRLVIDRRFARSMRRRLPDRALRTRVGCDAVIMIAGLSALLCLVLALIGAATAAALLAAAAFFLRPNPAPETRR